MIAAGEDAEDRSSDSESGDTSDSSSSSSSSTPEKTPSVLKSKSRRKPAWTDSSLPKSLIPINQPRLRKLRDAPTEDALAPAQYEARLRRQWESIHPAPLWASTAKTKAESISKQPQDDTEEADEGIEQLLTSTGGILQTKTPAGPGSVKLTRLRDANQAHSGSCGDIKSLIFHPSPQVPVLAVGSADRRVRLYNVCPTAVLQSHPHD